MIYECPEGHICFSKDDIALCGMKGCSKHTLVLSPIDINWFYKINERGLCINRDDLHNIIEDPNMPKDVKKLVQKVFPHL
jgi:hypothetical protein